MKFGSLDVGRWYGVQSTHTGVPYGELSEIFRMQAAFFFGTESFDNITYPVVT